MPSNSLANTNETAPLRASRYQMAWTGGWRAQGSVGALRYPHTARPFTNRCSFQARSISGLVAETLHWFSTTTPDFWTAILTGGLLAVAAVTAWIGLSALATANETARLEATPYLVVTEGGPSGRLPDDCEEYVVSASLVGNAPTLRVRSYEADEPQLAQGVTLSPHYGGRRDWPRRVAAIRNVGRSPAVDVQMRATFELREPEVLDYERLATHPRADDANPSPWSAGRDYPLRKSGANGSGAISIPAVAAGETIFVLIENRFAAAAAIKIADSAAARGIKPQNRIEIPVLAPKRAIEIPFRA